MYLVFFSVVAFILSRLKKTIQKEKNLARIDFLTDIPNLKGFYEFGKREIEKCKRYKRKLSIAYIDCDNFKQVNDTYGHEAGDKLLRLIAETVQDSIRNTDLVARLGGDEFVVMLDETGVDTVHTVMERVNKNLKAAVKSENFNVTFSVGVAIFNKVPDTLEEAVKRADELMYKVKKNGKNMVKYELLS
jgi:diguanylate cyclase (GGDEF)-like protein